MIYKITAIRNKDIAWSGGVFKKYEVRTDKTGTDILELRLGPKRNEKVKIGDLIEGYVESGSYTGKNGIVNFKMLKAISAEYVYKLLLKLNPEIESLLENDKVKVETTRPIQRIVTEFSANENVSEQEFEGPVPIDF